MDSPRAGTVRGARPVGFLGPLHKARRPAHEPLLDRAADGGRRFVARIDRRWSRRDRFSRRLRGDVVLLEALSSPSCGVTCPLSEETAMRDAWMRIDPILADDSAVKAASSVRIANDCASHARIVAPMRCRE